MANRAGNAAVVALILAIGACAERVDAADMSARIRPQGATLIRVVREVRARSQTFRALVETINKSDGIVYVEEGDCGHGVRACLVAVSVAGASRILRIYVNGHDADSTLMVMIGHELQHAVEVLSVPSIRSTAAMHFFYRRESRTTGRFETTAAMRTGEAVRDEVRQSVLADRAR